MGLDRPGAGGRNTALAEAEAARRRGPVAEQEALARIVAAGPTRVWAWLRLAALARQAGGPAGGLAVVRKALAACPGEPRLTGLSRALVEAASRQAASPPGPARSRPPGQPALVRQAETGTDAEAAEAIDAIARLPGLAASTAVALIRLAHGTGDPGLAAGVAAALLPRVREGGQRSARVADSLIRLGPGATLALAREPEAGGRSATAAMMIGRCLTLDGRSRLAERYLRRAARRWPDDRQILSVLALASSEGGAPDAVLARLEAARAGAPPDARDEIDLIAGDLLLRLNRLDEALAVFDGLSAAAVDRLPWRAIAQLHAARGDLARAEAALGALAAKETSEAGAGARARLGLPGALVKELRVMAAWMASGTDPERDGEALARSFFVPAAARVAAALPLPDLPAGGANCGIPRRILQYWDTGTMPGPVAAIAETWRALPGHAYCLMDRRTARDFIARHYGPEESRAFAMTGHPAEQADYLRLLWLKAVGGIYVDADDRRLGDPTALWPDDVTAVFCRERFGALANNFIAAAPGHPVLETAVEMATEGILSHDATSIWCRTGPGLLTRAFATALARVGRVGLAGTRILGREDLLKAVQFHVAVPYKSTGLYWNSRTRRDSGRRLAALRALMADAARGEVPPGPA